MNNDNVYINETNIYEYNNNMIFNPALKYPEGLDINIKSDEKIYNEVRNLLIEMKLDEKNIGTKLWNPFGEFIKKNDKVVIKPNLVKHINANKDANTDSLITNYAIIRPIIDYVLIALNNSGSVIIGDSPVQECVFDEVVKLYNLREGISEYQKKGYNIELKDFRSVSDDTSQCYLIDLNRDSEFSSIDNEYKRYAITNYNLNNMHKHHNCNKHEYLIAKDILEADVIINMAKPKCHRKAGITACLKNFIGANTKKEYIPHHRNGSIQNGGDEFPEKSSIKELESMVKNYNYTRNLLVRTTNRILLKIIKIKKQNKFLEGSWYGNDTIWRSILDINKIINYADKNGSMKKIKQRKILNIADMIVSGEKEGPLMPSNKKVGMIIASFNSLNIDNIICQIMGFNPHKIKYIEKGYKLSKYSLSENKFLVYNKNKVIKNINNLNKHFIPTNGWKDYLLQDDF